MRPKFIWIFWTLSDKFIPSEPCLDPNAERRACAMTCDCEQYRINNGICSSACIDVFRVGRVPCQCKTGFIRKMPVGLCVRVEDCQDLTSSIDRQRICRLPPGVGQCDSTVRRYYYDSKTQDCHLFTWGGCGGNENNFRTEVECRQFCQSVGQCPPGLSMHSCAFDPCQV